MHYELVFRELHAGRVFLCADLQLIRGAVPNKLFRVDDKKQLMEAIISLGTDAAGIVPSSTMIEFIESQKTTSVEIYENGLPPHGSQSQRRGCLHPSHS